MKNYKEMAEDVLSRINAELEVKKAKEKQLIRVCSATFAICIVCLAGVAVWQTGILMPMWPEETEITSEPPSSQDSEQNEIHEYTLEERIAAALWAVGKTEEKTSTVDKVDSATDYRWNGLHCTKTLYDVLNANKEKNTIYAVCAIDVRMYDIMSFGGDFVYEGMSYDVYWEKIRQESNAQEVDWDAVIQKDAEYNQAYTEYLLQQLEQNLSKQGIAVTVIEEKCYLFVTIEEFASIVLEDNEYIYFAHAGKGDDEVKLLVDH